MKSLSRPNDKHTGSYLAQRRRKRITIVLAALACIGIGGGFLIRLQRFGALAISTAKPVPKQKVLDAWAARSWDEVRSSSLASLAALPLDPFYLSFKGLASFYKAMELPEGEDRAALLEETVSSIRKALVVAGRGSPIAQMEYVLGKAYYHKGAPYFDEAVKYLEASISAGYSATDSREYLALAYAGLGEKEKAVSNFESALSVKRSELLLLAAARALLDLGSKEKAEALLQEAISSGTDELARGKCRFLLGDIYRSRGDGALAEEQYSLILEKDPESAEARYRLGLVFQERGDPVRARAEWRKAVALDPMHAAARQKLTEKL
jgi:tetratricopeptide (TPR) repeat protein